MKHNYIKLMLPVLLSIVSLSASAYNFEVGGIYYNITSSTDLTVAVTNRNGSSNSYSGQVSIPETVAYNEKTYRVTSIGDYAFSDCSGLTSVTIPNSVTSIGDAAFWGCSGVLTINCNIPSSSSYGDSPFYNSKFHTVIIGDSVKTIGSYAFNGCSSLTSITIPNSVTSIGDCAFFGCI